MKRKLKTALGLCFALVLSLGLLAPPVGAQGNKVTLLAPSYGENMKDNTPLFRWENVDNNEILNWRYHLVIDDSSDFSDGENFYDNAYILENSLVLPLENSLPDGVWYWKVRIENDTYQGDWSEVWSFRVDTVPPAPPTLLSPFKGENMNDNTPTLVWNNVSENSLPVVYTIYLDNEDTFSDPLVCSTTVENWSTTGTSSVTIPTLSDGVYYWKVKARDNAGNEGDWSEVRSFRVDTVADTPQNVEVSPSGWTTSTLFIVEWTNPPGSRIDGAYYKVDAPPTSDNDGIFVPEGVAGEGITSLVASVFGDGERTIYVWLKDNAGNVDHTKHVSVKVYVDTTPPPTPTISSPTHPRGVPVRSSSPLFNWNAVGGPSPVTYSYKLEGYDTDWRSTTSLSVSYAGVPDGSYTFKLMAREATGQVSDVATYSIVIDTTPSTITLTGLAVGAKETPSGWMLTTSESVFTLTGRVEVGSTVIINGVVVPVSGGLFSQTYNLSVGWNKFVIRVVDEAGNISERTLFVEYTGGGAGVGGIEAPAPGVPGFAVFVAALLALIFVGAIVLLQLRKRI